MAKKAGAKKAATKKAATKKAPAKKTSVDLAGFIGNLQKTFDAPRIAKATQMLKASRFQLFSQVDGSRVVGVVKSQTDADLVYSCLLQADGSFACCTQNLFTCGGLRGALCKHLLVLVIGLTQAGELEAATVDGWVKKSKSRAPELKPHVDLMSETFLRYKGAEAGQVDWRPTETIPEDYYAL